jgi:putative ABC transport system ATP-binding protein
MELLVRTAVAPNRAVIVVTHDARILDFADRMAFMEDGAITRVETRRRASTESGSSFSEVTHA